MLCALTVNNVKRNYHTQVTVAKSARAKTKQKADGRVELISTSKPPSNESLVPETQIIHPLQPLAQD